MSPEHRLLIKELYDTNLDAMMIRAEISLEDRLLARDVVQDTFHTAISKIEYLSTHENPSGWLMVTLKKKISEYNRAQRRYLRLCLAIAPDQLSPPDPTDELIDQLQSASEPPPLAKIKQILTKDEYRLLKRLTIDRASHLVVAKEFGISVYARQKRLERIRRKLARAFPGYIRKK